MPSPTSRALDVCRDKLGWTACVVEKFNSFTKQRKDAFGFGDLLVCHPSVGCVLLQVTSGANHASRETKIESECATEAMAWIASGGGIQVWSFSKKGAAGKRKLWALRRSRAFVAGGRIGFSEIE